MPCARSRIHHSLKPGYFGTAEDLIRYDPRQGCDILMIACSDHGTAPDNLSIAPTGRMMILQHLGCSVPSIDECGGDLNIGSVSHVLQRHLINRLIVCGHSNCQVIPTWVRASHSDPDHARFRARFINGTLNPVLETYPDAGGPELLERLIHEHVLAQLRNLATHPEIYKRLESGELKLYGWVVNEETARISSFNPVTKRYELW